MTLPEEGVGWTSTPLLAAHPASLPRIPLSPVVGRSNTDISFDQFSPQPQTSRPLPPATRIFILLHFAVTTVQSLRPEAVNSSLDGVPYENLMVRGFFH